jgi:hypothetical protein
MDPDPDPGGPKKCGSGGYGSGSATLLKTKPFRIRFLRIRRTITQKMNTMSRPTYSIYTTRNIITAQVYL